VPAVNAQQVQGVALSNTRPSVSQNAPTATKHPRPRSVSAPDWREELLLTSGAQERFQKDLDSGRYRPLIQADLQEAQRRAVLGSPVFFLNSDRVDGLQNEKLYSDIIENQSAARR